MEQAFVVSVFVVSILDYKERGAIMANIDLCGIAQLLRILVKEQKTTEKEAQRILARIATQTGADIIISL